MASKISILSDGNFRRAPTCSRFKEQLASKEFPKFPFSAEVPKFTIDDLFENGFDEPVLFESDAEIGLTVPSAQSSVSDIASVIGLSEPVRIIEVGRQTEIEGYTIGDYARYMEGRTEAHKIVNLISLEFSATPLTSRVQAPRIVRSIDWIDVLWPLERRARRDYPRVQKYLLCGMEGSYTDFHLDFGGTSVWYHVLWGHKRFYMIRPTCENLKTFESWVSSACQDKVFLPDLLPEDQCFQIDIRSGQTLLLPAGWIHAVYTPKDSLVFGGNFLHSCGVVRQLQVYSIENRTRVSQKYRFPYFQQMHWYALCTLLPAVESKWGRNCDRNVKDLNEEEEDLDEDLLMFRDSLLSTGVLRQWPFLVRAFQLWIESGSCPHADDRDVFLEATKSAGCQSFQEVLSKWWTVLERMAAHADEVKCGGLPLSMLQHVRQVKQFHQLNLLDPTTIIGAFASPLNVRDHVTVKTEEAETAAKQEVVSDVLNSSAPKLKLRLSLKNEVTTSSPSIPVVDPTSAAPDLKFRMPRREAIEAQCAEIEVEKARKLEAARSRRQQEALARKAHWDATAQAEEEAAGAGVATRGHRLSADFLRNAVDVEVAAASAENDRCYEESAQYAFQEAGEAADGDYGVGDSDEGSDEEFRGDGGDSRKQKTKRISVDASVPSKATTKAKVKPTPETSAPKLKKTKISNREMLKKRLKCF